MKFDHSKLMGLMREKKYSQEKLAKAIGISEPTLWNKLHSVSGFNDKEMLIISKVLEIENLYPYFFTINDGKSHH